MMNYYYARNIGTYPTKFITTTTTTPEWWEEQLYYTPASTLNAPEFIPPKWWRWYDVFRTWAKPKLLRLLAGVRCVMLRVQERCPKGQRRKQKRRAYVQRLHAL